MPTKPSRPNQGGEPPRSDAAAATITPPQNILVMNPGQTHSETIIVTIPAGPPIQNVQLVPTGQTAPFVTSINPAAGSGPLPPNQPNTVQFDVVFTGVAPCKDTSQVFSGALDVVVTFEPAAGTSVPPKKVVASKRVRITVPECQPEPEPLFSYTVKFVCGVQEDCACACAPVRPGAYATEINIYNYHSTEAHIRKHVVPVVFAGAALGREPDYAKIKADDKIVLPGKTATMDDCCRIQRLLVGGEPSGTQPLTIGFLEIVSDLEVVVSAVYTASDLKGGSVSIDVEAVQARRPQ
jgi:hypothetical protein